MIAEPQLLAMTECHRVPRPRGRTDGRRKRAATRKQVAGRGTSIEVTVLVQVRLLMRPHGSVIGVGEDVAAPCVEHFGQTENVIPVGVCENDTGDGEIRRRVDQSLRLIAGIDDDRLAGIGRGDDPTVGRQGADNHSTVHQALVDVDTLEVVHAAHRRGSVRASWASMTRCKPSAIARCWATLR